MYQSENYLYLAPLLIYVAWRLWTLVGSKWGKPLSTLLFALLVASYPVGGPLAEAAAGPAKRLLVIAAYDGMPALLYLVLTVVVVDLLIGLGRLFKVISREKARSVRFRRARLAVTLLIPTAIMIGGIINFKTVRIKEYAVEVPRRSSALEGLTIAFAADFHLGTVTAPGFLDKFAERVNGLRPDVILIGGDVFEGHGGEERMAEFESGFRLLRARFGVYGVPGNHEGYGGSRDAFFAQAGVTLLRDAVVRLDDAITLVGRNYGRRGRKSIDELLRAVPDDLPIIVMDHRPSDIAAVSRTRVDVQLSGHTHNGQIFPINWITKGQYLFGWGHLEMGRTHFFVTSGVQGWGPPIRTAGRSEIYFIRIKFN